MIMDSFATILEINFIVTYKMIIIFAYPLILERPAINSNQDGISLMMATFCRELNFYKWMADTAILKMVRVATKIMDKIVIYKQEFIALNQME